MVQILNSTSPQVSVPLYLRPDNPTVRPLTSHNAATHNVIVKVNVPKRTGRKRKRGSDKPFEAVESEDHGADLTTEVSGGQVYSQGKLDEPKLLRRKLVDNVGKYTITPVGIVKSTHRYRGKQSG
jgi:general transcription factor 3C polypeptide 5 (transcription factor C subunit 1)